MVKYAGCMGILSCLTLFSVFHFGYLTFPLEGKCQTQYLCFWSYRSCTDLGNGCWLRWDRAFAWSEKTEARHTLGLLPAHLSGWYIPRPGSADSGSSLHIEIHQYTVQFFSDYRSFALLASPAHVGSAYLPAFWVWLAMGSAGYFSSGIHFVPTIFIKSSLRYTDVGFVLSRSTFWQCLKDLLLPESFWGHGRLQPGTEHIYCYRQRQGCSAGRWSLIGTYPVPIIFGVPSGLLEGLVEALISWHFFCKKANFQFWKFGY